MGSNTVLGARTYRLKHYYPTFKKMLTKQEKKQDYATRLVYGQVLRLFWDKIWHEIIYNNYSFMLPERMGRLEIRKFKQRLITKDGKLRKNKLYINWKETKDLWNEDESLRGKKYIYHDNEHTNGYTYKTHWSSYSANFKNKMLYQFKTETPRRKQLSVALKDPTVIVGAYDSTFKSH